MSTFADIVYNELKKAREKHPQGMRSGHEAYAVILEEVDEFWELVKADSSPEKMLHEIKQIAAMCQRAAEDLEMVK